MLGAVRLHADANYEAGEYAMLLRSNLKSRGQGWTLMEMLIAYARNEDLKRIEGQVLRENSVMLHMCLELGVHIQDNPHDGNICIASLSLL